MSERSGSGGVMREREAKAVPLSHVVGCGGRGPSSSGPVCVEELSARLVHSLVCVRSEIIALRL